MQDFAHRIELRIPIFGKGLVKSLTSQADPLGQPGHTALRLCNVSNCQQERFNIPAFVIIIERDCKIYLRVLRIAQLLNMIVLEVSIGTHLGEFPRGDSASEASGLEKCENGRISILSAVRNSGPSG